MFKKLLAQSSEIKSISKFISRQTIQDKKKEISEILNKMLSKNSVHLN